NTFHFTTYERAAEARGLKYETFKSIILFALVVMSSVLSFLLWTYQPNYDVHEDTSYVSEVDVGGNEKTKGDLIKPKQIVFHHDEDVSGFNKQIEKERFFKDLSSWVLYEYEETDVEELPDANKMVEIIFPDQIPAETNTNLFTLDESR